jgi:putative restriction endonuclease
VRGHIGALAPCARGGPHPPVLGARPHEVANGLLLRTDIHRLFDKGYVTVSPVDFCFQVSDRLREDYSNGRTYYALKGKPVALPESVHDRPATEYLEWHAQKVFRG